MRRVSRLQPRLLLGAGCAVLMALLGACGHKSSNSSLSDSLIPAVLEIGQPFFHTSAPNVNNPVPSAGTMNSPTGGADAAVDTTGTVSSFWVADAGNNRVLGWDAIPTVKGQPATRVIGQPNLTTGIRQLPGGGANFTAGLARPGKVSVSDTGQLVIADTGHNRVLIYNTPPTAATMFTAVPDVIVGQTTITGSGPGLSATQLNAPGAAMLKEGSLVVADTGNNRVLVWSPAPTTNGAPATLVLGQSNTVNGTVPGCNCQAGNDFTDAATSTAPTQYNMKNPADLWTDGSQLMVADTGFNRILYWTGLPTALGVNGIVSPPSFVVGQTAFTFTFSTAPTAASMNAPTGIGSNGNVMIVADTGNNRALYFNRFPPFTNGISADFVLGQGNFSNSHADDPFQNGAASSTGGEAASASVLSGPQGASMLPNSLIAYLSDTGNNRVMFYNLVSSVTVCQSTVTCPQPNESN